MMMTRQQGQAIAALMASLRDDWDQPGCLAAVAAVKDRDPSDVAMAAIRLCATDDVRTPGALKANGQHWRERVSAPTPRQPPRREQQCPKHPGEWPDLCRGCASDRLAGDDSTYNPRLTPAPEDKLALARAALTQAKANLCSHGISPRICLEKHEQSTEEKA